MHTFEGAAGKVGGMGVCDSARPILETYPKALYKIYRLFINSIYIVPNYKKGWGWHDDKNFLNSKYVSWGGLEFRFKDLPNFFHTFD